MIRYKQQIILSEYGVVGQESLDKTAVLVVGAGGLGTIVSAYLCAMGIGKIGLMDFDNIEESNLHRQFLYSNNDIGKKKVDILGEKLALQNMEVDIKKYAVKFTNENAEQILPNYTIICDCTDDLNTRIALDAQSKLYKIPLIHGAVSDWQGYLTIFNYKKMISYSDLFSLEELQLTRTCNIDGISSPVCGIIGSFMANEVVKIVLNIESNLDGKLFYVHGLNNVTRLINIRKITNGL